MKKVRLMIFILLTISCQQLLATPSEIFLLRHSEKLAGKDPALSTEGKRRAQHIATLLAPYRPTLLLSTSYQRTEQTIAPLAQRLNLTLQHYNPRELSELAIWLNSKTGVVVIVGHRSSRLALRSIE